MKKPLFLLLTAILAFPSSALAFNPGFLISDIEMTDRFALDLGAVQNILNRGTLAHFVTEDIDGKRRYASDIIWRAGQRNGISSKVILTMLQKEQSLVEDPSPNQGQFDWAMGYAVCDSCNHDTPTIQRFKGFSKQINSATLQLSAGYLADLATSGKTVIGYQPGRTFVIDSEPVYIENDATAALYTYTPHLHGNENFVKIYNRYFGQEYPTGTLLQDAQSGGVFLISHGKKRPFLSMTALVSRYNPDNIISVEPGILSVYPDGLAIAWPNYSLLDTGENVYLLVDDVLRPFASRDTLRDLGFTPDEPLLITQTDIAGYEIGRPITSSTQYANGLLVKHPLGTHYYIEDGKRHIVATEDIRKNRYADRTAIIMTSDEISQFPEDQATRLQDGSLVRAEDGTVVYIISEGTKRPIANESTFVQTGWDWKNVQVVSQETLLVHPLGSTFDLAENDASLSVAND